MRVTVRDLSRKVDHLSKVIWDLKIMTEFTRSISSDSSNLLINPLTMSLPIKQDNPLAAPAWNNSPTQTLCSKLLITFPSYLLVFITDCYYNIIKTSNVLLTNNILMFWPSFLLYIWLGKQSSQFFLCY